MAKLSDSIENASADQRRRAVMAVLTALIAVFNEPVPLWNQEAATRVRTAYDLATTRILRGREDEDPSQLPVPMDLSSLLGECGAFLRELRVGMVEARDPWLSRLITKALTYQVEAHLASVANEDDFRYLAGIVLQRLHDLGSDGNTSDDRCEEADSVQAAYLESEQIVISGMPMNGPRSAAVALLHRTRAYMKGLKTGTMTGSESMLSDLVAEIDSYVKSATLTPQEYAKRWAHMVSLLAPRVSALEAVSLQMKGQQMNLQFLPDRDLATLGDQCGAVDQATGRCADLLGAQACLVEREMRAADAPPRGSVQRLGVSPSAQAVNELEPTWHLFKVEAARGADHDGSGDLYAYLLVSALSASALKAEELARQAVDEALSEAYAITSSQYLCPCDRDIFNLVQSDELLPGFETDRTTRAERPRG